VSRLAAFTAAAHTQHVNLRILLVRILDIRRWYVSLIEYWTTGEPQLLLVWILDDRRWYGEPQLLLVRILDNRR
jgi:hypothetical protein